MDRGKFPFVEVHWLDACSAASGWVTLGSLPTCTSIISRGWKVHEDKTSLTLAGSMDSDVEGDCDIGEVITIPRKMVTRQRVMVRARKK